MAPLVVKAWISSWAVNLAVDDASASDNHKPAPRAEMFRRTEMVDTWRVDVALVRSWRPLEPALDSLRVLNTKPLLVLSRGEGPAPSPPPAPPSSGDTCLTCLDSRAYGCRRHGAQCVMVAIAEQGRACVHGPR